MSDTVYGKLAKDILEQHERIKLITLVSLQLNHCPITALQVHVSLWESPTLPQQESCSEWRGSLHASSFWRWQRPVYSFTLTAPLTSWNFFHSLKTAPNLLFGIFLTVRAETAVNWDLCQRQTLHLFVLWHITATRMCSILQSSSVKCHNSTLQ